MSTRWEEILDCGADRTNGASSVWSPHESRRVGRALEARPAIPARLFVRTPGPRHRAAFRFPVYQHYGSEKRYRLEPSTLVVLSPFFWMKGQWCRHRGWPRAGGYPRRERWNCDPGNRCAGVEMKGESHNTMCRLGKHVKRNRDWARIHAHRCSEGRRGPGWSTSGGGRPEPGARCDRSRGPRRE